MAHLLILFRMVFWTSVGKELTPWLSTLAVLLYAVLTCLCFFPIQCLGQNVELDCTGSWPLPWSPLLLAWTSVMHFKMFYNFLFVIIVCLCWGLTSQSTIFQSCWDGATASWVINQYFRGVKCLAQGHNTAAVGFEPPTSRSGVRHSTTEPPRSPML